MEFGYSTKVLFLLVGSTLFSALLITLLYFLYKKRDGKDTGKPFVFTNCMTGEGIDELVALIRRMALFDLGNNKEKVSESLPGAVR